MQFASEESGRAVEADRVSFPLKRSRAMTTEPKTGEASKPWINRIHPRTRAKTTAPSSRAGGAVPSQDATCRCPRFTYLAQTRTPQDASGTPGYWHRRATFVVPTCGRNHLGCAGLSPSPCSANGRRRMGSTGLLSNRRPRGHRRETRVCRFAAVTRFATPFEVAHNPAIHGLDSEPALADLEAEDAEPPRGGSQVGPSVSAS